MELHSKNSVDQRLLSFFYELKTTFGLQVQDDTILQKLQSGLKTLLHKKINAIHWSMHVGLLEAVSCNLQQNYILNCKTHNSISFSLHLLSFLLSEESNFLAILDHKLMTNFLTALPILRKSMSLSSASLKVFQGIISHQQGLNWIIMNNLWEKLLFPCLESKNIFVQQECIKSICLLLIKSNSDVFTSIIRDLELLRHKFQEINNKLLESCGNIHHPDKFAVTKHCAELQMSNHTVLLVFNELLIQTLGKQRMYTKLRSVFDLSSHMILTLKIDCSTENVILLSKMLLLSTIHKFQENLLKFGSVEQFHLDSATCDLIKLSHQMVDLGHFFGFICASFGFHKYWNIMCKNIKDQCDAELSKSLSLLYVIARIQVVPVVYMYSDSLSNSSFEDEAEDLYMSRFVKWTEECYDQMVIKEEHKKEVKLLEEKMIDRLKENSKGVAEIIKNNIRSGLIYVEHFHPTIAVIMFKAVIFALYLKSRTPVVEPNFTFLQHLVLALQILLEKFSIDWRNCWLSLCSLRLLCDVVWIPGITMQIKVTTLKGMKTCVEKFIPPAMTALMDFGIEKDSSLNTTGKVLPIYLSDKDWEVRDSVLEFIAVCMQLAHDKYPFFIEWALNLRLTDAVLLAVGDEEPYIQASALTVLSHCVQIEKIWEVIKSKGIKQLALRAVHKSGDGVIKISGLKLVKSLYTSSRFSQMEIDTYVMPVIQKSCMDDDDEEIRLLSLEFIYLHIEKELLAVGMVDGMFARVTFYKGKIQQLEETDIRSLVLSIVSWFCRCGYCFCILKCLQDPVSKVSTEAEKILKFICSLVCNYNIEHNLEWMSGNNATASSEKSASVSVDEDMSCENSDLNEFPSSQEIVGQEIESVLDTFDLDVLERYPQIEYNPASNKWWWNGDDNSHPLSPLEFPSNMPAASSNDIFRQCTNFTKGVHENKEDLLEREILSLLEDIHLEGNLNKKDEVFQLRDCY